MAQDRLVQNAGGSVTLIYANGARQTVPASNRAGLLQLAERVPAEQIEAPVLDRIRSIDPQAVPKTSAELRTERVSTLRSELENQYNNLVKLDPNAAYRGRTSDLPTVFNQQAQQLADAGVTSITNLKIQDGKLVDSATGKTVTNSNLGGQVAVDRDTGVQKWGDIFSGVEGGANYGIQALDDGSVVLFPAWEKSKSLTSQIVGSDLFKVASIGLAAYGLYNLGTTLAGAGGAEAVTAAAGGGGSAISGAGLTSAEMAALKGGSAYGELTAAQAATGAAGAGSIYALPSGSLVPGSVPYSELTYVPPASPGLPGTVAGLEAPGLSSMGGGTGLLAPVSGGVVSEMGLVPAGATPALGDPSSFINDPNLLYGETPGAVITEDYLAKNIADGGSMNMANALKALQYGSALGGLLGGPQQQGLIGGGGVVGRAPGGVDYSELLGSLTRQASVPGVAPLIGPVVQPQESLLGMQVQPVQYQPLNRSLLG